MTPKVIYPEQQEGLSDGTKPPECGIFTHQEPYGVPPTEITLADDQEGKAMTNSTEKPLSASKPRLSAETLKRYKALPPESRQEALAAATKTLLRKK